MWGQVNEDKIQMQMEMLWSSKIVIMIVTIGSQVSQREKSEVFRYLSRVCVVCVCSYVCTCMQMYGGQTSMSYIFTRSSSCVLMQSLFLSGLHLSGLDGWPESSSLFLQCLDYRSVPPDLTIPVGSGDPNSGPMIRSHSVTQAGLELLTLLLQRPWLSLEHSGFSVLKEWTLAE